MYKSGFLKCLTFEGRRRKWVSTNTLAFGKIRENFFANISLGFFKMIIFF